MINTLSATKMFSLAVFTPRSLNVTERVGGCGVRYYWSTRSSSSFSKKQRDWKSERGPVGECGVWTMALSRPTSSKVCGGRVSAGFVRTSYYSLPLFRHHARQHNQHWHIGGGERKLLRMRTKTNTKVLYSSQPDHSQRKESNVGKNKLT